MSSTKIRQGIESGKYSGWDDVKIPTAASLKKQGYKTRSILEICRRERDCRSG